jgi:hypothetical protein
MWVKISPGGEGRKHPSPSGTRAGDEGDIVVKYEKINKPS